MWVSWLLRVPWCEVPVFHKPRTTGCPPSRFQPQKSRSTAVVAVTAVSRPRTVLRTADAQRDAQPWAAYRLCMTV